MSIRFPWITALISMATVAFQLAGEPFLQLCEWRCDWSVFGDWWRIVSGHFVHWSWNHMLWDLLVFAILGAVCELRGRIGYVAFLLLAPLASEALLAACERFQTYRGLSGYAMGAFALAALDLGFAGWRERRWELVAIAACAVAIALGKIVYEATAQQMLFAQDGGFAVAWEAHIGGIAAAFAASLIRHSCLRHFLSNVTQKMSQMWTRPWLGGVE